MLKWHTHKLLPDDFHVSSLSLLRTSAPQTFKRAQRARWCVQEEIKERDKLTRAQKYGETDQFLEKNSFLTCNKLKEWLKRIALDLAALLCCMANIAGEQIMVPDSPRWPGPFPTKQPSRLAWLAFLYVSCSHTK